MSQTFTYLGSSPKIYLGVLDPRPLELDAHFPGQLIAKPGDVIDFGDADPPSDGWWADDRGIRFQGPELVHEPAGEDEES